MRRTGQKCRGAEVLEALPSHFAAYLAGFVDGDGSIFLTKRKRWGTWTLTVQLGGVGIPFIKALHAEAGSPGCVNIRNTGKNNRKPCAMWTMTNLAALTFLRAIRPWLRLKREQAEVAIAFQELTVGRGVVRPGERYYTGAQQVERAALADQMRALNAVTGHLSWRHRPEANA